MANEIAEFIFKGIGVPNSEKYLDLAAYRHKLISGNVSNVSTPGYRGRDFDFDAEYKRLTGTGNRVVGAVTHESHIPTGNHVERPPDVSEANVVEGEMNSVDIDREMSALAQNELRFSIGARLLKNRLDGLRKAITSE